MRVKACLLVILSLITCFFVFAQEQKTEGTAAQSAVLAFTNVNVVPMDRERVLENQTVIVRDGRIAEIGSATQIKVPEGAQKIDGTGKYLMPGLAEMHGHLPPPNQGDANTNAFLTLFVANGVTTVRVMYGFPNSLDVRKRVVSGQVLGPTLFLAGPAMSGQSVQTPEKGEELVRKYKQDGYDLLKIHEGLSVATYDRIVAVANELKMPFGGHIPNAVGLEHAIKSRQGSVEHLDGFIEALEADNSPVKNADGQTRAFKLVNYLDESKLPALLASVREAGTWNAPTMALWENINGDERVETLQARPENKYVPPQMLNGWSNQRQGILDDGPGPDVGQRVLALRNKILKALAADGRILLGSDAPQLFSVPGFSLHREMQAMVRAGLTPYQVLSSGTRNPAVYLNSSEFGTVEVGKRADLILVNDNPLKDVGNVAKRTGVVLRGTWLPESEIQKRLDDIIAARAATKPAQP
jgi:hypothetical protein